MPTYNFSFFDNNHHGFSSGNVDPSDIDIDVNDEDIIQNYTMMNNQSDFLNAYYDDPDYHHNLNPDIAMHFLP